MSTHDVDRMVQVHIAADGSSATLRLAADFPPEMLSLDVLRPVISEAGVEWNEQVDQRVRALLHDGVSEQEPVDITIAEAVPVQHGTDGCVQWDVDEQSDADATDGDDGDESTGDQIDFYQQSAYVMVEAGQTLGRIVEPQAGEDGRDVTGKTYQARAGRAVNLKLDETINQASDGTLTAAIDGMLVRQGEKATISNVLEIPEYVDFSTGNVDFDGEVMVRKGVRDRFEVRATGTIEIHGLIEAASIDAGGQLIARRGMAGREIGAVKTGSDVTARYLNQVTGTIGGALNIEREVIGCELTIGGALRCDNGRIIGGRLVITGASEVGELGSEAGVPTELVLGTVPVYEQKISKLREVREKLSANRDQLQQEQQHLAQLGQRAPAEQREKQTELLFKIQELNEQIDRADDAIPKLEARCRQQRTISLTVQKTMYANVRLTIDGETLRIEKDVRGPLHVTTNDAGEYVCRVGDAERPLRTFARTLRAAA